MLGKGIKKQMEHAVKATKASTLSDTLIPINDNLILMQAVSCTAKSKKRLYFETLKTNHPSGDRFVQCRI